MAESAALLVDEVLPREPMRQWVLSFPYPLRFLFASGPAIMGSCSAASKDTFVLFKTLTSSSDIWLFVTNIYIVQIMTAEHAFFARLKALSRNDRLQPQMPLKFT